jgi:hypothetical protein
LLEGLGQQRTVFAARSACELRPPTAGVTEFADEKSGSQRSIADVTPIVFPRSRCTPALSAIPLRAPYFSPSISGAHRR